jgi:sec-independent protein translocase protein TatA
MFGSIGTTELILILAIVLLIFGVGKLPEVFKALGSGVREFRDAASDEPPKVEDKTAPPSDTTPDA